MAKLALLLACIVLSSCGQSPQHFEAHEYPTRLSEWGLVNAELELAPGTYGYTLNTALFSDYAEKGRSLYIPSGSQAIYQDYEAFNFPVGTLVSKTFYFPTDEAGRVSTNSSDPGATRSHLVETRLLVKQKEGWDALPYVWNGDDAYLAITGKLIQLETTNQEVINYLVPSKNQCASCHATDHTTGDIQPIGLKARHLHRDAENSSQNQLVSLVDRGWLQGLPPLDQINANADFADTTQTINHRARSYLDINCGHCHNPNGAADTSGLLLDYQPHSTREIGTCKPPIAAGRGSGGLNYSIVPGSAERSILAFRMASRDPAVMMPELGRTLSHTEGVALIESWINQQSGECL